MKNDNNTQIIFGGRFAASLPNVNVSFTVPYKEEYTNEDLIRYMKLAISILEAPVQKDEDIF